MSSTTNIHPDAVLEVMLAKGGRSHKLRNLKAVHEICRSQYASNSRDFSIPTIGKLCEEKNILKARALYNTASMDYRDLITVWAAYVGPPLAKAPPEKASSHYLMGIPDPAIRSMMQGVIVERDYLKAQINMLKSATRITVDRRPMGVAVATEGASPIAVLTMGAQLTSSEKMALRKAISEGFLADRGWKEVGFGEVVNEQGRTVYDPGYVTAIRKLLKD